MVKSKKDVLKKEKDNLLKELQNLIVSDHISDELRTVFVELLDESTKEIIPFREKFGLKPVKTKKKEEALITDPIYAEIVNQLLQCKTATEAIERAAVVLGKPHGEVEYFYDEKAGGQNKKNIQKTVRRLQLHIDYPIYCEVVAQLCQGKNIKTALDGAGKILGKSSSQMSYFYNKGDYKKYIQNNFKQAQKLIDMNKK